MYNIINPLASPSAGAPALNYGDVNTETTSPGEVKGLILCLIAKRINEESENAVKNDIIIQKYVDKNTILLTSNYKIENNKLIKAYNIQNRGVEISSIQRKT